MSLNRFTLRVATTAAAMVAALLAGAGGVLLGSCGPFTDFTDATFCPFVLEIFYLGITTGTTPTTYDPSSPVTRLQMAAFLSRTVDGVVRRRGHRAALNQNWTPQNSVVLPTTSVGSFPFFLQSDGTDVWVAPSNGIVRVRASDGKYLESWPVSNPASLLVAMGGVLVFSGASLSVLDPRQSGGALITVASNLTSGGLTLAFDGARVWIPGHAGPVGQVVILTPTPTLPWTSTTVTAGFEDPFGILFDGKNVWVTDPIAGSLSKLDSNGAILQTVTIAGGPSFPVFDQANVWVPNQQNNTVTVVRASSGLVLQTLIGNGLNFPYQAAFDGERILVTNSNGNSVSLWKAADLTPLGSFSTGTGTNPRGVCSDGKDFWIAFHDTGRIARF